jgi:uncharacterized phage protein (TIGR01671 family)
MIGTMTREIKFRAWDKKGHEMFTVIMLAFPFGENRVIVSGRGGSTDTENDDCILMQFTGLHDKNFMEIWEGDIVQRVLNPIEIPHPVIIKDFIEYRGGCFILSNRTILLRTSMPNIEVVGNIYENPELLQEATK